eukprot:gene40068-52917_t
MNPTTIMMKDLRAEAAIEPTPMKTGEANKETQIIAIYGKGGIGKSFTLANLSYMMAQQGKKVLLIGCDPKSDTTSLLFGGKACPTIIETSSRLKLSGQAVSIGDVCFKRDGVYAMELGGPEVGRGCGGRGIIHGFELLEKLGFHEWGFDYVLLDFLGDVVCGGFASPLQHAERAVVVAANDFDSIFAMNRIVAAIKAKSKNYEVRVGGVIANRSAGTDEIDRFNAATGLKRLAHFPDLDAIRRSRLKKATLFEMGDAPEVLAVQREYMNLAEQLWAGGPALDARPMKDREIFDFLGELQTYFDRTAVDAWARLTTDAPVSGIRATVRAGRDAMRNKLLAWL